MQLHSLAKMVTVVLVEVPNADLGCLSSLTCVTSLTLLAAHQPTDLTDSLAELHNLLHLHTLSLTGYLGLSDKLTGLTSLRKLKLTSGTDAACDMSHMQQLSALILSGIDSALHRVTLPSSTSLVRLQHLRFADIVDGGDMAMQNFERENLEAAQELNVLEFGSCYPSNVNRPDGWPRSLPHLRSLRLHCMSYEPPFADIVH